MYSLLLALVAHAGGLPADILTQADAGATEESGDRYGWALATGDFDGDGFEDLATGSPYEDDGAVDTGMITVHYGGWSGIDSGGAERITQRSVVTATNEDNDRFGWSLAVGDFDHDGYDDLAVGVPYEDTDGATDTGMVAILYGSPSGLLPSNTEAVTQNSVVTATNEDGDLFGWSLAAGDFDRDGFDDLAVGVPYEDTDGANDTGLLGVLYGSPSGLLPSSSESITQNSVITATNETGDHFGLALAAGDFDRDGYDDLAVGVPDEDTDGATNTGMVGLLYGSSSGLLPSNTEAFTQSSVVTATNENQDRFGFSLAVGDLDDDGYDDLVVGVPYEDSGAMDDGMIAVMYGTSSGLLPAHTEAITQLSAGEIKESGDRFGYSLAVGDLDDDGVSDLVVGMPWEDHDGATDNGAFAAFFGSTSGLLPARADWWQQGSFGGAEESNDRFGHTLAVGDFDGDGRDEVAVGAPYEAVGNLASAGAAFVSTLDPAVAALDATGAIVIDAGSGQVLGAKRPDHRRAMASTTKVMTALLVSEEITAGGLTLNTMVTVGSNATLPIFATTSLMGLATGDRLSVRDLLYGLMLPSGNDAAVALAEAVAGSEAAFADMMNDRAEDLGLDDTSFVYAHGRDPEDMNSAECSGDEFGTPACAHYSTPRDLATLARFAMGDPLFATIVGTPGWMTTTWVSSAGVAKNARQCSSNDLIRDGGGGCSAQAWAMPGAYGIKTGTTDRAGACLVAGVDDGSADVISVILGSTERYAPSTALLEWGLSVAP